MEYKPTFQDRFWGIVACEILILFFSLMGSIGFHLISIGAIWGDSFAPMMFGNMWFLLFGCIPFVYIVSMMFSITLKE